LGRFSLEHLPEGRKTSRQRHACRDHLSDVAIVFRFSTIQYRLQFSCHQIIERSNEQRAIASLKRLINPSESDAAKK